MPLDFPPSPTNGQVYANWVYSTSKAAWQAKPLESDVAVPSPTPPSTPNNGDLWFNSDDGNLYVYYNDGDTSQWVQVKSDATLSSTLGNRVTQLELPGRIVQVVSATKADTFTTTSTSITDVTGLAVTITPKSSSNKIIVLLNTTISATASGTHNYQLFRDSTYIGGGLSGTYVTDYSAIGTQNGQYNVSANFLDSPSTSSAITYKLRVSTSTGTLAINRRALANDMGSISTITVMEVVG
jgi:hypothetical protein